MNPKSFRLSQDERYQLAELAELYGENETDVVRLLIGERYQQEIEMDKHFCYVVTEKSIQKLHRYEAKNYETPAGEKLIAICATEHEAQKASKLNNEIDGLWVNLWD